MAYAQDDGGYYYDEGAYYDDGYYYDDDGYYYDDAPRRVNLVQLLVGVAVLACAICALASLTLFCGAADEEQSIARGVRRVAAFAFGCATALASIALAAGLVGTVLHVLPPTKLLVGAFVSMTSCVLLAAAGLVSVWYVAPALGAVKDPTCATHTTTGRGMAVGAAAVGAVVAYRGWRGS